MFTNRYIFIYSSVMVIIVAAILSSAAMILKPYQERNIAIAKIQGILMAAEIEATTENAESMFDQVILEELVINQDGKVTGITDPNKSLKLTALCAAADPNVRRKIT